MAFVTLKPFQASSCFLQRPALGFGHSGGRPQFGAARVVRAASLRRRLLPSLRCSTEEKPEVAEKPATEKPPATAEEKSVNGHSMADSPVEEEFGGWSVMDAEPERQGNWKVAILGFGAGVVLAIGVSVVSYSFFQKQGKKFAQSPRPQASTEESKVLDEAPPQQEKTSSPGRDYPDDDDVTFDDYSNKDGGDDFDEELEDDVDVDVDKQQDQPNAELAGSINKQGISKQTDQPNAESAGSTKKQDVSKQTDQPNAESAGSTKKQGISEQTDQPNAESGGSIKKQSISKQTDQLNAGSAGSVKKQGISKRTDQYDAKAANKFESGTQGRDWKVVVPAFVDHMHELALSALQSLKIVEDGVDPGAVCTRRNYARWLIATSSTLTRSSANKVLPAMYIGKETDLAFDDVMPDDPDFAAIQGLAEAGLIPSKLSIVDAQSVESEHGVVHFSPDSPLSRLDLVCWKVALHHRSLPAISKEDFQEKSGFMDVDRIESRAWPAVVSDLYSGDSSIIATAFGFTRMLQPQKPVTNGQAAIALAYGDSSEQLGEEIARIEAEQLADEAVAADAVMEARTQKEVKALFDGELGAEKKQREEAVMELEEVKSRLEKITSERDSEKDELLKDQATVEAQKTLLREIQQRVDDQLQSLAALQVEVSYEKDRLEKITTKAEEDQETAARLKMEIEAEKKSLILARLWAEEEAQKARAQHQLLDEARQRWASRGIEVTIDKSLDEDSIPGPSWRYSGGNTELEKLLHRAPIQDVMDKGEDLKTRVNNGVVRYWYAFLEVLSRIYHRIVEWLRTIRWRISELSEDVVSSVSNSVQNIGSAVVGTFRGAQSSVSETFRGAQNSVSETFRGVQYSVSDTVRGVHYSVSETVRGAQSSVSGTFRGAQSSVSIISAGAVGGTKRFADGCRTEIGKIRQRFKHD